MKQEPDDLRLYALAFALVPDPNAAGDLFMQCRSETALRDRARRWREAHGLAPEAPGAVLPGLSDEQRAHALHLAKRIRTRQRLQRGLGAAAVVVLAVVGALLLWRLNPEGLSADPAFTGKALTRSDAVAGRRLSVFRAEASAGAVTVWWDLAGPGLSSEPIDLAPELIISGPGYGWMLPVRNETARPRPDRIVGRSIYTALVGPYQSGTLALGAPGGRSEQWLVRTPFSRIDAEQGARTIEGGRSAGHGGYTFTLRKMVAAPTYTQVRYQVSAPSPERAGMHFVRVQVRGNNPGFLEPVGPPALVGDEVEVIFQPLPAGTASAVLHFDLPDQTRAETVATPAVPGEVSELLRNGDEVSAKLVLSTFLLDRHTASVLPLSQWPGVLEGSYFKDTQGRRYGGFVVNYSDITINTATNLWLLYAQVPQGVDLRALQAWLARLQRVPGAQITVRL